MIPLRTSQVVFYATIVTLTVALVVSVGFWFIRGQMLTGNDFLLDAESKEIVARVNQISPPIDAAKLETALREHTEVDEAYFYFQVHDPSGKILFRSPNLGGKSLIDLTGGPDKRTINLPPLGLLRIAEYHIPGADVQIALSLSNFQEVSFSFIRVLIIGVPVIAVLSVGFGIAMRHFTLRPVRSIQEAARRISATNLGERIVVPPGSDEMTALAELLNDMIGRLEKSFKNAKRFSADVSHELMTPLSIIRLHTERMLNDPDLPAKHHQAVEEQLQETLHLADVVERLLMLAKADSSALSLNLEPVATAVFIQQFAEDAQLLVESRGLKIRTAQNDPGKATIDHGWMRQALFNLLSNARRFSPSDGTITIYSKRAAGEWTVEVWDEGQGVPQDRLNDIFERFVQIEQRADPGSGAGLGLAICKSIVELHHGRISARNRTDRSGFIVSFTVPCEQLGQTEEQTPRLSAA